MFFRKKKPAPPTGSYDRDTQKPVIRAGICTGEQTAGFQDLRTGHFTDVCLIRCPEDLTRFRESYGIDPDTPIEKIY